MFWLIPIVIWALAPRIENLLRRKDIPVIYMYALAATYVDHAIGSILFLYMVGIPAIYWRIAMPYVPLERAIYALGITLFYIFIKKGLESMHTVVALGVVQIQVVEPTDRREGAILVARRPQ